MIRLFTAIEVPEDLHPALCAMQAGLPGAQWVPPENFHITLRFIGEVPEPAFDEIAEALWQIQASGFSLKLSGVDKFGGESKKSKARSVFASVKDEGGLVRLAKKIDATLQSIGLEPDHRKFRPHVTLGRLKDTPPSRLGPYITDHAMFSTRLFNIAEFVLFSSQLSASAPLYEPLARFALTGPTPNEKPLTHD